MATVVSDARERAFERLYRRYVQDVYRYALAVLRNPADAEDVTQTTFLNAYRAYLRGEEPRKPQHWLITIAHNACRTRAIRASRRPREVPLDTAVADIAVPEQERPNIHAVLGALGRLPFNQRAAIVMRELEGRSYEEIAEMLGVSVSAVETLIFRARRSLRVRREALRGLSSVSVPASLQSFAAGGVVQATGGVAAGGLIAKAAAVIAALVAGTAGYEAIEAGVTTAPAQGAHQPAVALATPVLAVSRAFDLAPRVTAAAVRSTGVRGAPARPVAKRPHDETGPADADADPRVRQVGDGLAVQPSSQGRSGDAQPTGTAPAVDTSTVAVPKLPAPPSLPEPPAVPETPSVTVPVSPPAPPPVPSAPSLPEPPTVPSLPQPPPLPPPPPLP